MVQAVFANYSGEKLSHPGRSGKPSLCCSHKKAQADLTSCKCQRGNVPSVPSIPPCFPGLCEGLSPASCWGHMVGRSGVTLFQAEHKSLRWQWLPVAPSDVVTPEGLGVLQPHLAAGWREGSAPGGGHKAPERFPVSPT